MLGTCLALLRRVIEVCSFIFDLPANYLWATWHVFHLSTTLGCISILELLQFTIVLSYWASFGKALFKCSRKRAIKVRLREERLIIALGQTNFRGALQVGES